VHPSTTVKTLRRSNCLRQPFPKCHLFANSKTIILHRGVGRTPAGSFTYCANIVLQWLAAGHRATIISRGSNLQPHTMIFVQPHEISFAAHKREKKQTTPTACHHCAPRPPGCPIDNPRHQCYTAKGLTGSQYHAEVSVGKAHAIPAQAEGLINI
jgi:hypothetical protein